MELVVQLVGFACFLGEGCSYLCYKWEDEKYHRPYLEHRGQDLCTQYVFHFKTPN